MIKEILTEEKVKQRWQQMEEKLNIGNGTIRKWNEASPTFENVLKVAKYFDVSMDYFTEREER